MEINLVSGSMTASFQRTMLDMYKALSSRHEVELYDYEEAYDPSKPTIVFGSVTRHMLRYVDRLDRGILYGAIEGYPIITGMGARMSRPIIAVSKWVKTLCESVGLEVRGVVYHGIDLDYRATDPRLDELFDRRLRDNRVYLYVAGNVPRKALDKCLVVHKLVQRELRDAFLILHTSMGGPGWRPYYDLDRLVKQLQLDNIWITDAYGAWSDRSMNSLYRRAEVYAHFAVAEGFGLPIIEAYRWDTPIVAVDMPPIYEIVRKDRTGILVNPVMPPRKMEWMGIVELQCFDYRVDDMADAIIRLLGDGDLRERMASNIREYKSRFSHLNYLGLVEYLEGEAGAEGG